nr:hypothetical protein [Oscillospiraceae bacterium]
MEEYREYRKSLFNPIYKKEVEQLGNNDESITYLLNAEFLEKEICENNFIILNFTDYIESIDTIKEYLEIIKNTYEILAISFMKSADKANYTQDFLIGIFCASKSKYSQKREMYEKIFRSHKADKERILKRINEAFENKYKFDIEANMYFCCRDFKKESKFFGKLYLSQFMANNKNYKKLKNRRIINNIKSKWNKQEVVDINHAELIAERKKKTFYNKEVIEEEIEVQIQEVESIQKVRKEIANKNLALTTIINIEDDKRVNQYIKVFKELNSNIIVIEKTEKKLFDADCFIVSNIEDAKKITQNDRVIYVSNNDDDSKELFYINDQEIKEITQEEIMKHCFKNIDGLKVFANLDHINSIKVLTGTFLDFEGENYYSGGAERYLLDLYEVSKHMGFKLRIYQRANYPFVKFYNDIEVVRGN